MKNKKRLFLFAISWAFSTFLSFLPAIAFAQRSARVVQEEEAEAGFIENLTRFVSFILNQIPRWVGALIIFVLFIGLARMAKKAVESRLVLKIAPEHQELTIVTSRMAFVVVTVVGITAALGVLGVNLMNLIAAVGLGISFGMQDFFGNFFAGIMILLSKPFTIGDFISVGGQIGQVQEIQSRVTVIRTLDGLKVVVPNGMLFKNQITNYTGYSYRRFSIIVGVEYRTDLAKAIRVCMEVMKKTPGVIGNPIPKVLIDNFGNSSIALELRFWTESRADFWTINSEVRRRVKKAFDEVGITIPFPISTLVLDRDSEAATFPILNISKEDYQQKLAERLAASKTTDEATQKILTQHEDVEPLGSSPMGPGSAAAFALEPDEVKPELAPATVAVTTEHPTGNGEKTGASFLKEQKI